MTKNSENMEEKDKELQALMQIRGIIHVSCTKHSQHQFGPFLGSHIVKWKERTTRDI